MMIFIFFRFQTADETHQDILSVCALVNCDVMGK